MTKIKSKKGKADKVRKQRKLTAKSEKTNPFDIKVNRQKHEILGKKVTKFDRGNPGVSRMKAINKRKKTLLAEYKFRNKANSLIDRRIGEGENEVAEDEIALKRFAHEKRRKSQLFNLADDDDALTHYGQKLSEIEKFDDPAPSDSDADDDDDDRGKIGAAIVADEHFGGGMLTMKKSGNEEEREKTWKERMEEVIAKSKKAKYERQMQREQTVDLTEKLDNKWKELRNVLASSLIKADKEQKQAGSSSAKDEYDSLVHELRFETRVKPTDKLKSEAEIALEEKKRLEKLEQDRNRRMKGIVETSSNKSNAHISADSLEENFAVTFKETKFIENDEDGDDDDESVSNEDDEDEDEDDSYSNDESENEDNQEDEHSDNFQDESDSNEESNSLGLTNKNDKNSKKNKVKRGKADNSDEDDDEDESEDEDKDEESDFESDIDTTPSIKSPLQKGNQQFNETHSNSVKEESKEAMIKKAEKELPYTFKVPSTVEDLKSLLVSHTDSERITIITRMIKCHHPSLNAENKSKLQTLYGHLLRYYCEALVTSESTSLTLLDQLVRPLYDLTQQLNDLASSVVLSLLTEYHDNLNSDQANDNLVRSPGLKEVLLLKLISLLFPTSDFQHSIVTPAMLFMSQIITRCPVYSCRDLAAGLFICCLFLEYVSVSKRFAPGAINFLIGAISLNFSDEQKKTGKIHKAVLLPFRPFGKYSSLLRFTNKRAVTSEKDVKPIPLTFLLPCAGKAVEDEMKISLLHQAISLLSEFAILYENLPSFAEIFGPALKLCKLLDCSCLPSKTKETITKLTEFIEKISVRNRHPLLYHSRKVVPIKQHTPKIIENFDLKKKRSSLGSGKNEEKRLLHKYKRELKGATREIRRDNEFLARHRIDEQMKLDSERKRKVKEIYHQLATQEGEVRALKRLKDKL